MSEKKPQLVIDRLTEEELRINKVYVMAVYQCSQCGDVYTAYIPGIDHISGKHPEKKLCIKCDPDAEKDIYDVLFGDDEN